MDDFAFLLDYLPHTCCGALVALAYLVAVRAGWLPGFKRRSRERRAPEKPGSAPPAQ